MTTLSTRLGSELRFRFSSAAFAADKFDVVNLEGFEAINRPYRFALMLVSDDAEIDFDKILKNSGTLCIYSPDGTQEVPYHGVIAEFEQLQKVGNYVYYRAVLVPRLWRLSLYKLTEVYLNEKTIPEILEGVLKESQFSSRDYQFSLTGDYRKRSFVCQFEETHLDFLSRLMEKEGIYYFFDQGAAKDGVDKLLVVDALIGHPASTVQVKYRPADELDTGSFPDCVQSFVCRQQPLPKRVIAQDYNYRKAELTLRAEEQVSADGIGDVMYYGENFRSVAEGQRYAKLRAEGIRCRGRVFNAESTAVGLRSGYFMALSHHYRNDFNGRYLVTEIHHRGSQAGVLLAGLKTPYASGERGTNYSNSVVAIPAATQFRAELATPKPRIAGTMNASVDSEGSGLYAELDEFGQYKIQLPFDLTDKDPNKGSAWVRMATPYSGSDHGMHFPLHKNAEVLLSFVDGDPDQPVIIGAVPNSENRSVVNNSNAAVNQILTKAGNQLRMNDTKGSPGIVLFSPSAKGTIIIGSKS